MDNCQVCYGALDSDRGEETILPDYLPLHRTFQLRSLERNSSYYTLIACTDIYGERWTSDWIYFTTGLYSVRVVVSIKVYLVNPPSFSFFHLLL